MEEPSECSSMDETSRSLPMKKLRYESYTIVFIRSSVEVSFYVAGPSWTLSRSQRKASVWPVKMWGERGDHVLAVSMYVMSNLWLDWIV
jgi:hypothetical protein